MWLRSAGVTCFSIFGHAFRKAVQEEGMLTTHGTVGIVATGKLDSKVLQGIWRRCRKGHGNWYATPAILTPTWRPQARAL